jgi:hypothetical protein
MTLCISFRVPGDLSPSINQLSAAKREMENCLRSFGQIARRPSGLARFLKPGRLTRLKVGVNNQ